MINASKPQGGAASSKRKHHANANSTANATPASTGVRGCNNVKRNPIVTAEKSTSAHRNNHSVESTVVCSITCPDGSILKLSTGTTSIILRPGRHGIPSTAATDNSQQLCVLHLVKNVTGNYSTELVALGSKSCRVTRAGNAFIVKSMAQIIADANDTSSSRAIIKEGDTIEPYHEYCSAREATSKGTHYPFKVNVSSASSGGTTASLNPSAKWLYDRCSIAKSNMEYPHSTLHLATKILTEIRQHYSSKHDSDAIEDEIQNLIFNLIDEGKKRDVQFVFDVTSKSHQMCKDHNLTIDALKDAALNSCGDYVSFDKDSLNTPTSNNVVRGQPIHSNITTLQRGESKAPVMDGSAFLEASRKIDEAAKYSSKASNEIVVGRAHFDNESFLETFLEDPTNTTNFFISYYKSVLKRVQVKIVVKNLLTTYVNVISPLESEKCQAPKKTKGVDDFPLKEILSLFIASDQLTFGKRVIEGYIRLSCQDVLTEKEGYNGQHFCTRTLASGPKLLTSVYDPLVSLCNVLGWDELGDLLVGAVKKLCEYRNVTVALDFCQNIASKSCPLSGREIAHRPRICARMFKVAYGERFHADPSSATTGFIKFYDEEIARTKSSQDFCLMLLGSFVDVVSPPNPENRRIPMAEITCLPLEELLSRLVKSGCHGLGKRVIDGYIWLSCQEIREKSRYNSRTYTYRPRGPRQLIRAGAPLQSICHALGWNELEDVLVEAVKKLCTLGNLEDALKLCQIASAPPDSSSEKDKQCFCVGSKMRRVLYETKIASFRHNPTETAKFVISCAKAKNASKAYSSRIITTFVDMMSPVDHTRRQAPLEKVTAFPLKEILSLLVERKCFALAKRVVEGYIWLSCQKVRVTRYHDHSSRGFLEVSLPKGPKLLVRAVEPLVSLCNVLGWKTVEDSLVESVQKICQYGHPRGGQFEYMETSLDLIEKIHPAPVGDSDCSRVCVKMATVACDEMFKGLKVLHERVTQGYLILTPLYRKFIRLIANFCPAMAPRFESFMKNVDVDDIVYPILTDEEFRSIASASDVVKNTLRQLTLHYAQLLHTRVSSDPDIVTAWTVPNAQACQNAKFRDFLQSHCKQTFDWQVRKSDHEGLHQEMRALVNAGDVECKSHRPGNLYHFKITKLKTCRVHLNVLSCSCSSYVNEKKITQEPAECLRHSTNVKRVRDEKMLESLKAFYLTPEEIRGLSSQKRKAVDALGNDADDVVLTGVVGVAETVAKRVKAAEDAGEVIEIL